MRFLDRRRVLKTLGTSGLLALAGCSGAADDTDPSTTTTGVLSPTATSSPSPTATPSTFPFSYHVREITPTDGGAGDAFGMAVDLSDDGTTALIGDDAMEGTDENTGSAYVFEAAESGWTQRAELVPGDGDVTPGDLGDTVALSGDGTTALVGDSSADTPNGKDAGFVAVFTASEGEWTQQATLTNGHADDSFGRSVAVSHDGTTALIDAPQHGEGGAAYVFDRAGGEWSQQAKLTTHDGNAEKNSGSVDLSDDGRTALVGGRYEGGHRRPYGGSAFVFTAEADGWWEDARLTGPVRPTAFFSHAVGLSGDGTTALVTEPFDGTNSPGNGAVHVFTASEAWTYQSKLTVDGVERFGYSVAVSRDGTTALVGAPFDRGPDGSPATGTALAFMESEGEWTQQAALVPDEVDDSIDFGYSVGLSGDGTTALAGAPFARYPNEDGWGSAYVFE